MSQITKLNAPNPPQDAGTRDVHLSVHGRVQGVGFREGMIRVAMQLRLDGWVRNRRDGTVEAVVRGATQECESLVQWSHRGPAAAQVERVELRIASVEESESVDRGFRCLNTR